MLSAGTRLGPYEIAAQIGEGGMGQVYRATDTTLGRQVAIKILPEAFATDPERLARFEREAKTLAALNHPNIAAIYAVEEGPAEAGHHVRALVMELVEGEDLSEKIRHGSGLRAEGSGLPIDEALPIAKQIAEALEAAHEQGIIHRDLKPANIKVRADGTVKVLDFGLAKALGPAEAGHYGSPGSVRLQADPSMSPTLTTPAQMTGVGMILGTAAYMAPEQARGTAVDRRADIWAFGVVLTEMLTGNRLFAGDTVSDVLAAVLTRAVDWTALPAATPPSIRRLLRRCLEKDRRRRLADAASVRIEIDEALSGTSEGEAMTAAPAREWRWMASRVVLPTVVATALIAGALAWSARRAAPTAAGGFTLTIVPPKGVRMSAVGSMGSPPQLSPDGAAILFQADLPGGSPQGASSMGPSELYVRRLDSLDVLRVPGSERMANEAFWHGSSRVTFPVTAGARRELVEVRLPDGAPDTLMRYSANVRGGGWSDDGTVVLGGELLTPDAGGGAKPLAGKTGGLLYPEFFPGTRNLLGWRANAGEDGEVCIATIGDGTISNLTVLFKNDTAARYTPSGGGRVLFVKNDNLYAQRLNPRARAVEGDPELIVRGVGSQPALARADFSVAANGTIAWRPGRAAMAQVMAFSRSGANEGVAGPPGVIDSVYVSPADGSRLLVSADPSWLGTAGEPGRSLLPRDTDWSFWSSDGRRVVGVRQGSVVARGADGDGAVESIGRIPAEVRAFWAISADRQNALGRVAGRVAWARVAEMAVARAWTAIADTDEGQVDASFSPDGRFVLYVSDRSIYVQPFPGPGRRQLVAQAGIDPVWRGDGKEILFIQDAGVWSVAVSKGGDALTLGAPQRLFGGVRPAQSAVAQSQSLAVTHDGSRFFLVQGVEQPESNLIHVMTAPPWRER